MALTVKASKAPRTAGGIGGVVHEAVPVEGVEGIDGKDLQLPGEGGGQADGGAAADRAPRSSKEARRVNLFIPTAKITFFIIFVR